MTWTHVDTKLGTEGHLTDMPSKSHVMHNGQMRWKVEYGRQNGHRKREFFATEKEADKAISDWNKRVKVAGSWWAALEEEEQLGIQVVVGKIKDAGLELDQVWAEHQAWKKDRELPANSTIVPTAYEDVVAEWKRRKLNAGADTKYVTQAGVDLLKFGAGQERRPISEIHHDQLDKWVNAQTIQKKGRDFGKPWGLSTKRTWLSLFHGLWEVAVINNWAAVNVVDKIEPIAKPGREKRIYPNDTVMNIMAACLTPGLENFLIIPVLGFFGCMRPEEISSDKPRRNELPEERWFLWSCIDLKHGLITVSTDVAKEDDERVIQLQPVAVEWLKLCKELNCALPPFNQFRLSDSVFDLIGLDVPDRIRDGCRKNCATHLRPVLKNDYDVVRNMGHSVRILLKNYAKLMVPEARSLEYWMITPERVKLYMKSREWLKVQREATEKRNKAIAASAPKPAPSANGNAKVSG